MKRIMIGVIFACFAYAMHAENLVYDKLVWDKNKRTANLRVETNSTYKTSFFIPEGHEKNRWMFEAERAGGNFMVSVNGKKIGECQAPFIRFPLSNLVVGTNNVEFFCSNSYDGFTQISEKTNPYRACVVRNKGRASYKQGFFGQERIIELSDPGDIRVAWAETSFREKTITLKAKVSVTKDFDGTIACTITDRATGEKALSLSKKFSFKKGEQEVEICEKWANPKLWDVDQPNLYLADVRLYEGGGLFSNGKEIDVFKQFKFGFREVWVDGKVTYLNGHPFQMRMEMSWFALNEKTYGFFKYIGRNTWYVQPHGNSWWGYWGETPELNHKALDLCDEKGILVCYPATGVSCLYELCDTSLHASYKQNLIDWIDNFRNHPSIIAWGLSMNAYNPKTSIAPHQLGQREKPRSKYDELQGKQETITYATSLCREVDPTRYSYGHADGNIGSFGSANCYPNMTPLQEVIEYPIYWWQHGDIPWVSVEHGVYDGSFFKDGVLMLTEYSAIYFGDKAYDRETGEQLINTARFGANARYYGGNIKGEVAKTTELYYDFMSLYGSGTDKYWRTYGILGWLHFFGAAYGQERIGGWNNVAFTEPDERPEWATRLTDIYAVNMQDLLAYIGGDEVYTDRTHSFFEGETMKKNFVTLWDSANPTNVVITWNIKDEDGNLITNGTHTLTVNPGIVNQTPIYFTMPENGKRTKYTLRMKTTNHANTMKDKFEFESFPHETKVINAPKGKVFFYDPKNKSAWVKNFVTNMTAYTEGQVLKAGDILIVGREALSSNYPLPYTMDMIDEGARVLILEQQPTLWQAFGFRLVDMITRLVYPTPFSGEFMAGLMNEDLCYWRGTPDLLPEYKHARQVVQPIKGVNRHGVASTVFEIPEIMGVEPIFQCEFDQRFSPLLRLRGNNGRGFVYMSSFDFTDRVGVDPAATKLAKNILMQTIHARNAQARRDVVTSVQGSNTLWKAQILVNEEKVDPRTDEFLKAGGIVLNVALKDEELTKRGVKFKKRKLYRVDWQPQFERSQFIRYGVTRNMLRWRDELEVNTITEPRSECDGIWARKGNECFLQVYSKPLAKRYDREDYNASNGLSEQMIDLLKCRVLTGLGAKIPKDQKARLNTIAVSAPYKPLKSWYAYGPFAYTNAADVAKFNEEMPGEKQGISGDYNPNFTYYADDKWKGANTAAMDEKTRKTKFEYRKMVEADDEGTLNLTTAFELAGRPAYAIMMHVWEEAEECEGVFSFNFPSKAIVYLNGEEVFSGRNFWYGPDGYCNTPNIFPMRLKLKKGENAITVKLITLPKEWEKGTQLFGVTRAIEGASKATDEAKSLMKVKFYNEKGNTSNVYRYHFW